MEGLKCLDQVFRYYMSHNTATVTHARRMGLFLGATSSIDHIITSAELVFIVCMVVVLPAGAIMMLKSIRRIMSLGIFY